MVYIKNCRSFSATCPTGISLVIFPSVPLKMLAIFSHERPLILNHSARALHSKCIACMKNQRQGFAMVTSTRFLQMHDNRPDAADEGCRLINDSAFLQQELSEHQAQNDCSDQIDHRWDRVSIGLCSGSSHACRSHIRSLGTSQTHALILATKAHIQHMLPNHSYYRCVKILWWNQIRSFPILIWLRNVFGKRNIQNI